MLVLLAERGGQLASLKQCDGVAYIRMVGLQMSHMERLLERMRLGGGKPMCC